MITFFTIPRPFNAKYMDNQYRAIMSWTRFPGEVILFGDEQGTDDAAIDLNCRWYQDVNRMTTTGPPLIDSVFRDAQLAARYDLMCYINADILLNRANVHDIMADVHSKVGDFMAIGRRWDISKIPPITISVKPPGEYHCVHGEDYFFFTKGSIPFVPPFLIGRSAWDNWLVMDAQKRGLATVDVTDAIEAIHLGDVKQHHEKTSEYDYNQQVWHRFGGVEGAGYIDSTKYIYKDGEITER